MLISHLKSSSRPWEYRYLCKLIFSSPISFAFTLNWRPLLQLHYYFHSYSLGKVKWGKVKIVYITYYLHYENL